MQEAHKEEKIYTILLHERMLWIEEGKGDDDSIVLGLIMPSTYLQNFRNELLIAKTRNPDVT